MSVKSNIYKEYEEVIAFGKIQNNDLVRFITNTTCFIGREPTVSNQGYIADEKEQIIYIGSSQKLSRKHLKIYWDYNHQSWFIQNLSKNNAYINKKLIKLNDEPIELLPISSIQIDCYQFYYFQARELIS